MSTTPSDPMLKFPDENTRKTIVGAGIAGGVILLTAILATCFIVRCGMGSGKAQHKKRKKPKKLPLGLLGNNFKPNTIANYEPKHTPPRQPTRINSSQGRPSSPDRSSGRCPSSLDSSSNRRPSSPEPNCSNQERASSAEPDLTSHVRLSSPEPDRSSSSSNSSSSSSSSSSDGHLSSLETDHNSDGRSSSKDPDLAESTKRSTTPATSDLLKSENSRSGRTSSELNSPVSSRNIRSNKDGSPSVASSCAIQNDHDTSEFRPKNDSRLPKSTSGKPYVERHPPPPPGHDDTLYVDRMPSGFGSRPSSTEPRHDRRSQNLLDDVENVPRRVQHPPHHSDKNGDVNDAPKRHPRHRSDQADGVPKRHRPDQSDDVNDVHKRHPHHHNDEELDEITPPVYTPLRKPTSVFDVSSHPHSHVAELKSPLSPTKRTDDKDLYARVKRKPPVQPPITPEHFNGTSDADCGEGSPGYEEIPETILNVARRQPPSCQPRLTNLTAATPNRREDNGNAAPTALGDYTDDSRPPGCKNSLDSTSLSLSFMSSTEVEFTRPEVADQALITDVEPRYGSELVAGFPAKGLQVLHGEDVHRFSPISDASGTLASLQRRCPSAEDDIVLPTPTPPAFSGWDGILITPRPPPSPTDPTNNCGEYVDPMTITCDERDLEVNATPNAIDAPVFVPVTDSDTEIRQPCDITANNSGFIFDDTVGKETPGMQTEPYFPPFNQEEAMPSNDVMGMCADIGGNEQVNQPLISNDYTAVDPMDVHPQDQVGLPQYHDGNGYPTYVDDVPVFFPYTCDTQLPGNVTDPSCMQFVPNTSLPYYADLPANANLPADPQYMTPFDNFPTNQTVLPGHPAAIETGIPSTYAQFSPSQPYSTDAPFIPNDYDPSGIPMTPQQFYPTWNPSFSEPSHFYVPPEATAVDIGREPKELAEMSYNSAAAWNPVPLPNYSEPKIDDNKCSFPSSNYETAINSNIVNADNLDYNTPLPYDSNHVEPFPSGINPQTVDANDDSLTAPSGIDGAQIPCIPYVSDPMNLTMTYIEPTVHDKPEANNQKTDVNGGIPYSNPQTGINNAGVVGENNTDCNALHTPIEPMLNSVKPLTSEIVPQRFNAHAGHLHGSSATDPKVPTYTSNTPDSVNPTKSALKTSDTNRGIPFSNRANNTAVRNHAEPSKALPPQLEPSRMEHGTNKAVQPSPVKKTPPPMEYVDKGNLQHAPKQSDEHTARVFNHNSVRESDVASVMNTYVEPCVDPKIGTASVYNPGQRLNDDVQSRLTREDLPAKGRTREPLPIAYFRRPLEDPAMKYADGLNPKNFKKQLRKYQRGISDGSYVLDSQHGLMLPQNKRAPPPQKTGLQMYQPKPYTAVRNMHGYNGNWNRLA